MEGFLHAELFHAAFHHAELLHVSNAVTPAGADQGQTYGTITAKSTQADPAWPPLGVPYPKITS
jgi:hypothetical protein